MKNSFKKSCINLAIEKIVNLENTYTSDVHHEIFNTDYFIIGYYEAEQFIKNSEYGIFEAIEKVISYEKDMFGETNTKINSEAICNMVAYIVGEEILAKTSLSNLDNERLSKKDIVLIKKELKQIVEIADSL